MSVEKSLVIIKPDGIKRQLAGLCLSKLEILGLNLVGTKLIKVPTILVKEHYKHLKTRPFFNELINETAEKKVLAFVFEGKNAVSKIRKMVGATNPEKARCGTIRNGLGRVRNGRIENVIHASSSSKDASREIKLWFNKNEFIK